MPRITGFKGTIPAIGAYYPRYSANGTQINFRNTNTGKIRQGIKTSTGYKLGAVLGYEVNKKNVYGHDPKSPISSVGNLPKLKAMKLNKVI